MVLLRRSIAGQELTNREQKILRRTLTDLASVIPIGFLMLLPVRPEPCLLSHEIYVYWLHRNFCQSKWGQHSVQAEGPPVDLVTFISEYDDVIVCGH